MSASVEGSSAMGTVVTLTGFHFSPQCSSELSPSVQKAHTAVVATPRLPLAHVVLHVPGVDQPHANIEGVHRTTPICCFHLSKTC